MTDIAIENKIVAREKIEKMAKKGFHGQFLFSRENINAVSL